MSSQSNNHYLKRPPSIEPLNFSTDMFDTGTPRDARGIFNFLFSPAPISKDSSAAQKEFLHVPLSASSCIVVNSPNIKNKESFSDLSDSLLRELLDNPESKLTDSFLNDLALRTPSSFSLFTPENPKTLFSSEFLEQIDNPESHIQLLSPKKLSLITPKTPVIIKRNSNGQDQLNIYIPPQYTPGLVKSLQQSMEAQELTMFPFPPTEDKICDQIPTLEQSSPVCDSTRLEGSTSDTSSVFNINESCMESDNSSALSIDSQISHPRENNCTATPQFQPMISQLQDLQDNHHPPAHQKPFNNGPSNIYTNERYQLNLESSTIQEHRFEKDFPTSHPSCHQKRQRRSDEENDFFDGPVKDRKVKKSRRTHHNITERCRRSELHQRFQNLRDQIPALDEQEKSSKIQILKAAISYIQDLHSYHELLKQEKSFEKNKNNELLNMIARYTSDRVQ